MYKLERSLIGTASHPGNQYLYSEDLMSMRTGLGYRRRGVKSSAKNVLSATAAVAFLSHRSREALLLPILVHDSDLIPSRIGRDNGD